MAILKPPSDQHFLCRDYGPSCDGEAAWPRPSGTPNAIYSTTIHTQPPAQDVLDGKSKSAHGIRNDYKTRHYGTITAGPHKQPQWSPKGRDPLPLPRYALHIVLLVLGFCATMGVIVIIMVSICMGANAFLEWVSP